MCWSKVCGDLFRNCLFVFVVCCVDNEFDKTIDSL